MPIDTKRLTLQLAEHLREIATRQGNVPFRQGGLRKSLVAQSTGPATAAVGTNLIYARAVHDGAVIRPRKKKMLAFPPPPGWTGPISKKTGQALARKVTLKPNPYLARAAELFLREGLPPGIRAEIGDAMADDLERRLRASGLEVRRG